MFLLGFGQVQGVIIGSVRVRPVAEEWFVVKAPVPGPHVDVEIAKGAYLLTGR